MITVYTEGTTEISGGKLRKLNFVFKVTEAAADILVADAGKVRFRSKYRKQAETMADGQTVTVLFDVNGDKLSMNMIDERELERAELMAQLKDRSKSPEELLEIAERLRDLL